MTLFVRQATLAAPHYLFHCLELNTLTQQLHSRTRFRRLPHPQPTPTFAQDPEQDSAAMSLLCSITKASANAVPEICSPPVPFVGGSRRSRLRPKELQRPRASSVNSTGSGAAASSESGEFYRLSWYRRPLPSNRRTSVASGEAEVRRRNSMLVAPRASLRPPRVSTGGAAVFGTVAAGSAPAAAAEGTRASGQQQEHKHAPVLDGGMEHGVLGVVAAAESASEPPLKTAHISSPPSSSRSSSSAFGLVADSGTTMQQAVANTVSPPAAAAPTAAEIDATPAANSMAADRGVIVPEEGATANSMAADRGVIIPEEGAASRSTGDGVAATATELEVTLPDRDAESDEVIRLRAEVLRLKQEMASTAAAAAAAARATSPPTQQKEQGGEHRSSPSIDVTSPFSSSKRDHSTWEWNANSVGGEVSPDAGKGTRPVSARLRADNSWMQRRRNSDNGYGGKQNLRNSFGGSASNGIGFGGKARAGSVLPAPGSDASRGRGRVSDDGCHGLAAEDPSLLSPPAHGLKVEGPSPASGEKSELAKAFAADRRRKSSLTNSVEETGGSGRNDSASSNGSVRQMSVFFPVQQPTPELNAARVEAESSGAVTAEGAAALARAVATQIGAANTPPEAARAAQAARDAVSAKRQHGDTRHVATAPVERANDVPVSAAAAGRGAEVVACRRRRAGDSHGKVWRWVLAQRMGNQTVRQALVTHGLPSFGRRHIWAAWAAVATPEM